ncbi:hypothetical protein E2493_04585 [Sphingomonas parva]|uniref:Putative Na(+)/H(+) antiporter NhaA homolog n=1 Tax=Sphingomonas parva TaxID=2555898 RepID=A0A4Y8ZVW5_9SPHN|nr:Na+/H+ antiporter NhaA [Sphingomonas parva]TFI59472.1 hypothetical protein E2493_04585 [Sphingomonas parva]
MFVGKQTGIFGAVWPCVRLGFARRLRGATWMQVWSVDLLCAIGFTMGLLIGGLSFPGEPERAEEAKIGILAGSFLSTLAGWAMLRLAPCAPSLQDEEERQNAEIAGDGDVMGLEER